MSEIGLTASEVSEVKRTWDIVKQNQLHHGVAIFVKIFIEYPTYQSYFKVLKTVAIKDLPDNIVMKSHALKFMKGVTSLINNLGNKEELLRLIMGMTKNHHMRNINSVHFEKAFDLLHGYLTNALGNELNVDGASGWKKTLDVLLQVILADIKDLDSQQ